MALRTKIAAAALALLLGTATAFGQSATPVTLGTVVPQGVSTTTESGHVIKAARGNLIGFQTNNWSVSTGLTIMVLDASTVPSNGSLVACTGLPNQTNPCVIKWYGIAAAPSAAESSVLGANWASGPLPIFLNGLVLVCSTTGPYTLTLSANCTFSAEVQ
jgi:hypothetical protein